MDEIKQNSESDEACENRTIVWQPFGLLKMEFTNMHRIIENGSINIPRINGVIPAVAALSKLMFAVIVSFVYSCLIIIAAVISMIYILAKELLILAIIIVFGLVSILLAFIGINIKAAMLNSIINSLKN